jgi:hypothetical protein
MEQETKDLARVDQLFERIIKDTYIPLDYIINLPLLHNF